MFLIPAILLDGVTTFNDILILLNIVLAMLGLGLNLHYFCMNHSKWTNLRLINSVVMAYFIFISIGVAYKIPFIVQFSRDMQSGMLTIFIAVLTSNAIARYEHGNKKE